MLIMIIRFLVIYDIEHVDTVWIISGTSESPLAVKVILNGLYLSAMLCVPAFCLMINEHRVISFLYCVIVLFGTIIGKENFWVLLLVGFGLIGMFFGSATEVIVWIIRLFFQEFNGEWICVIAQVVGHGLTVSILCFPIQALEKSEDSNSAGRKSYSSGSIRSIDYNEELREIREKEQLETLKRIERDLKYK